MVILMEILGKLVGGPKRATRLANASRVSFPTFVKFANELLEMGLIEVVSEGKYELYTITERGTAVYSQYANLRAKVGPKD
jgi:predicted transcriptional regulator